MVYVICGPIGSGKTTYAKANFETVLDFDEIGSKEEQLTELKRAISDGKEPAYITCFPTKAERTVFDACGGVTYLWINTTEYQCIRNIRQRGRIRDIEDINGIREKNHELNESLKQSALDFQFVNVFETNERW